MPTAPIKATKFKSNLPSDAKKPEKGIMISDGKGIKADSIVMVKIIPGYPNAEMIFITQFATISNMLYIVATPIGNLQDITLRALEVLKSVDSIICEDTRRTGLLLNHYGIKKEMTVLNDYNEHKNVSRIINLLNKGQNLALVSDAGTPLISDPGYKLVKACLENNIEVDSIPGPSSVTTALILSGLPPDKFLFLGYLPERTGHRIKLLNNLTLIHESIIVTYIIFISPHKLIRTFQEMQEIYGDIEICLAHELTKIHQSVETKKISEWLSALKFPKGEYILLFRLDS